MAFSSGFCIHFVFSKFPQENCALMMLMTLHSLFAKTLISIALSCTDYLRSHHSLGVRCFMIRKGSSQSTSASCFKNSHRFSNQQGMPVLLEVAFVFGATLQTCLHCAAWSLQSLTDVGDGSGRARCAVLTETHLKKFFFFKPLF